MKTTDRMRDIEERSCDPVSFDPPKDPLRRAFTMTSGDEYNGYSAEIKLELLEYDNLITFEELKLLQNMVAKLKGK